MPKLVVKSLRCVRGGRVLIPELSFTLGAAEGLLVQGPNGAGKTTLLRAIAGLFQAEAGTTRLEGGDDEKSLAEQCCFIGHLNGVKPSFTASENLRFIAAYFEIDDDGAVDEALATFGLEAVAHVPAAYLSAGQKRRLGLCRLLLMRRPLWLLDEPSVSLDLASQAVLAGVIRRHLTAGGMAIVSTHMPIDIGATRVIDLGSASDAAHGVWQ